jgi:hypothetical protein
MQKEDHHCNMFAKCILTVQLFFDSFLLSFISLSRLASSFALGLIRFILQLPAKKRPVDECHSAAASPFSFQERRSPQADSDPIDSIASKGDA